MAPMAPDIKCTGGPGQALLPIFICNYDKTTKAEVGEALGKDWGVTHDSLEPAHTRSDIKKQLSL